MRFCLALFLSAANLTFEVASVKPSPPVPDGARVYFGPARGGPGTSDPTQITWTYATMKSLIMTAYDAKAYQISGPDWMTAERYDVMVRVPSGATKDEVNAMWRSLLAERFGLVLRHESREFKVEELVVGSGGAKLKATAEDPAADLPAGPPNVKDGRLLSPGYVVTISPGTPLKVHAMARAQPISRLTGNLSNDLGHPVLDKTGLTGMYDFTLDYNVSGPAPGDIAGDPGIDLASAVQQQLGLRLLPVRANIDVMIVEKLNKVPTSN